MRAGQAGSDPDSPTIAVGYALTISDLYSHTRFDAYTVALAAPADTHYPSSHSQHHALGHTDDDTERDSNPNTDVDPATHGDPVSHFGVPGSGRRRL